MAIIHKIKSTLSHPNKGKPGHSSSSFFRKRNAYFGAFLLAAFFLVGDVEFIYKNTTPVAYEGAQTPFIGRTATQDTDTDGGLSLCKLKSEGSVVESFIEKDLETKEQLSETLTATAPPLQLLRTYMQQHSEAALQNEHDESGDGNHHGRRFIIAYYSCPQQAGNRLHHLFNAYVWGMVLNRTVLVQYYTKEACLLTAQMLDPNLCKVTSQPSDCEEVLHRQEWMPLYQDWKNKLGLPSLSMRLKHDSVWTQENEKQKNWNFTLPIHDAIVDLSFWSTRGPAYKQYWRPDVEKYVKIDARLADIWVIDLPQMIRQDAAANFLQLRDEGSLDVLLATPEAVERARSLIALGQNYLFGMLFRHMFEYRPVVLPSQLLHVPDNVFLLAVHSRHEDPANDGSDIHYEVNCIDQVLQQLKEQQQQQQQQQQQPQQQQRSQSQLQLQHHEFDPSLTCVLVMMSDRTETLRLLEIEAKKRNCVAVSAPKTCNDNGTTVTPSWRQEHGPFSGMGFYEDLSFTITATAPRAIQAFISERDRSSSQLFMEQIEYDRFNYMMVTNDNNNNNDMLSSLTPMVTCDYLPGEEESQPKRRL